VSLLRADVSLHAAAPTDISPLSLHDALPISEFVCVGHSTITSHTGFPNFSISLFILAEPLDSPSQMRRRASAYSAIFLLRIIPRSEEHTSELQSRENLVCRLPLEKKNHSSTR